MHRDGAERACIMCLVRIVRKPMTRQAEIQYPSQIIGGLDGKVIELLPGDLRSQPLATNRLEDSSDVNRAALHIEVGLLADDEGSAAVALRVAPDRPDIDEEDIVV